LNNQVGESIWRAAVSRRIAYAYQGDSKLFRVDSWSQVMLGQRIMPKAYHLAARMLGEQELTKYLAEFRASVSGFRESVLQGELLRLELKAPRRT
jgi:tryptophan halogenase